MPHCAQVGACQPKAVAARPSATSATELAAWLQDNGYYVNDTMAPFMQSYLDAGMKFVAAKLVPGAGVDSIKRLQLSPRVMGSGVLGHLEGFRRRHRDTLWPLISSWLVEQAPSTQPDGVSAAPRSPIAAEAGPHGASVQGAGG